MNKSIDAPSNLMEISVQKIKVEPPDEADVGEVNISKLFENDLFSSKNGNIVPLNHTKIVREDADPDEFIKEEPRFGDEFEIHANYERSPKLMTLSADVDDQKECGKANDDEQTKKRLKSAESKAHQSQKPAKKTQKAKRSIQNEPVKTGNKAKLHENHRNKAASSTTIHSRRHPAKSPHPKSRSAAKPTVENPTFECFLCKDTVSSANNLKRHYVRFHGEKSFHCNLCPARFSVKFSLDIHKRSHSGEKPYECEICLRKFATKINLRRHNKSCWPMSVTQKNIEAKVKVTLATVNRRDFECYLCKFDENLKKVQDLKLHMITKHTGANVLPCIVCRLIFSTQSELAQHILCHTNNKPYECDTCKMRFTTTRNLKRHKRLHTRVGLYKCDECGREYTTKFSRDAHQKKHVKK